MQEGEGSLAAVSRGEFPPFLPQRLHPAQPLQPIRLEGLAAGRPALSTLGRVGTRHSSHHLLQNTQSSWLAGQRL